MDTFSFVFSLYSIILGLALTEVLGGAASAVKGRRVVRIGWLTGLLSATLVSDITLAWRIIWRTRAAMPDKSTSLFAGVVICGLYYFASALLFPGERFETDDLDDHFMAEKSKILGCIWLANALAYMCRVALMGWNASFLHWGWTDWGELVLFMTACGVAVFISNRRLLIILISVMLVADLIDPVFSALGFGA